MPRIHLLFATLTAFAIPAAAQTGLVGIGARAALDDLRLAEARGTFTLGNGFQASFGITRTVAVNGEIVAIQGLVLRDLDRAFRGGAPSVERVGNAISVLQLGPNNAVGTTATNAATPAAQPLPAAVGGLALLSLSTPAAANTAGLFTGIQNTLDNVQIQTRTRIDASVASLDLLRAQYRAGALRDAMIRR